MADRPNFLFIITDQHRGDHLGCAGHPVLKTPHIDSIAAKGTKFDRFYVATPVCQPNRSTLMTGRMPSLHGVRHNGISLSTNETTFIEVLLNQELGEPFRRDAMKKPVSVAGIDPSDMRPQTGA